MNKEVVLKNILWKLGERGGVQVIQFIVQLVLARILSPNDYGTLAIILVFINLSNVFIQSGLPSALIQKKEIDKTDISSVFITSLAISIIFILIIWFSAPYVAAFYNDNKIIDYLRVLSLVLIVGSFNAIQIAIISKGMEFKKIFLSSLIAILISAIVGIAMALGGFGIWALIFQYIVNILSSTVILFILKPWLPTLEFSFARIKRLFNFGINIMFANIISNVCTDLYSLIIGKVYNRKWLGFYDTGTRIPSTASNSLTTAVQSVLLPAFSSIQDDKERIKLVMRKSVQVSAFFIFPILFILAAIAEPLIRILLTEKWILAVPFMQLACVIFAFYPIHLTNLQAINAIGRSDIFLKCEIYKKLVELAILAITIWFNIYILAIGRVIGSLIALYINMSPNKRFINYGFREQILDFAKPFVISLLISLIMLSFTYVNINDWLMVTIQITMGVILYILLSKRYNLESYEYILDTLKNLRKK